MTTIRRIDALKYACKLAWDKFYAEDDRLYPMLQTNVITRAQYDEVLKPMREHAHALNTIYRTELESLELGNTDNDFVD